MKNLVYLFMAIAFAACKPYDTLIKNGTVYDGSGKPAIPTDIGIKGDKVVKIGNIPSKKAKTIVDAEGMAVSPGFINTLSWAYWPLLKDGRSMSNLKQGVTLEIFGEGSSPGPFHPEKTKDTPSSFAENMEKLEQQGVSTNIASFVGATTVRKYVLDEDDRAPNAEELALMKQLVEQSMEEGALGLGTSLIYPPAFFAKTDELIALSKSASKHNGIYISHLRSEGDKLLEAIEELITIAREANIPAEIYHLKAAGQRNWEDLEKAIAMIEKARAEGLEITTNMYNYTGASTGLGACMPPWIQEGGEIQWVKNLQNAELKAKAISEMESDKTDWENFLALAGDPANILLLGFSTDSLQKFKGKNLAEVAKIWGKSPAESVCDLISANGGDISTAYFLMSEENVARQMKLPYMSFGSDARSIAAEGENLESMTHPRTYGNFARLLGKYVREEKIISLEEAIHKLSWLPVQKLHIKNRGRITEGYFADIVIFDPTTITDKATFNQPHQYAEGVQHVFVNGTRVIKNGEHTGETPGRFVKGKGAKN
ncbi:D-aminoacylase [Flammeovirgaceae bacterium SG7u.111]|nr:D-aminoacylase [Flammeovirgaceae bacterium SG7u.132]WPO35999.1 D-aminoacylase [Flammeovirgaceae bacterium SG7u.111]